jgi:Ca2+-binding EF-hand superfamily protein
MNVRFHNPWIVACLLGFAAAVQGSSAEPSGVDLVVANGQRPLRIRLAVELEGESLAKCWSRAFAELFEFCDHTGDGWLDQQEAATLPSPFAVRRVLWGQIGPYPASPLVFATLDSNQDLRLSLAEIQSFYQSRGLEDLQVGIGHSRGSTALNQQWLQQLDANRDGQLQRSEAQAAAALLKTLDRNNDEMLQPSELLTGSSLAGSESSFLLAPPIHRVLPIAPQPVMLLPCDPADTHWASELLQRWDGNQDGSLAVAEAKLTAEEFQTLDTDRDKRLSASELAEWRSFPAAAVWHVRLSDDLAAAPELAAPQSGNRFELSTQDVRLSVVPSQGHLATALAASRDRYRQMLRDHDADDDGTLSAKEIDGSNLAEVSHLGKAADRNRDGELTRAELDAWLKLQARFAANHVLLSIVFRGGGLFEFLDQNLDSNLSTRELREAESRLEAARLLEVELSTVRLPELLVGTVSRGRPQVQFRHPTGQGPPWFAGMDRNGDGDISRAEFLGEEAQFQAADADGDGLLSLTEAAAIKSP